MWFALHNLITQIEQLCIVNLLNIKLYSNIQYILFLFNALCVCVCVLKQIAISIPLVSDRQELSVLQSEYAEEDTIYQLKIKVKTNLSCVHLVIISNNIYKCILFFFYAIFVKSWFEVKSCCKSLLKDTKEEKHIPYYQIWILMIPEAPVAVSLGQGYWPYTLCESICMTSYLSIIRMLSNYRRLWADVCETRQLALSFWSV